MKKFAGLMMALVLMFSLCVCGNMAVLDPGNFTFNHIHTDTYHSPMCFNIEKWWDNSTGIEVKTESNGTMYFSEGDYILIENESDCPYCNVEE